MNAKERRNASLFICAPAFDVVLLDEQEFLAE
jgi:hypothetical protein